MRRQYLPAIALTSVGLLIILCAGCATASGATQWSGLEKTDLTVGAVPVGDEASLYVAKDEGLFAKVGLNVTIDSIVSSATATKEQNNGTFDITAGNSVSYIQDQVTGASNLEIVAEGSLMQPNNQPSTPARVVDQSLADLKGAKIGVNAPNNIGTLLISSVLEEHGVSPKDVHFVTVNFVLMGKDLKQSSTWPGCRAVRQH